MKTVFDWTKEINTTKSHPDSFTDQDWEVWNSYMVHKVLSMNPKFTEIVNEIQTLPPTSKKEIYTIYRDFIPRNREWSKYIKSKTKEPNKDLVEILRDYFKLSSREIKDYIRVLSKDQIQDLLTSLGKDKKEIKKLLK